MFIIKYKKFFISLSIFFVVVSTAALVHFGLPLGIDFRGGSQLQFSFTDVRPETTTVKAIVADAGFPDAVIQPTGENGFIMKSRSITETEKDTVLRALAVDPTKASLTTIGPSVGVELRNKAIISVVLVLVAIICFVAYAFRKVSKPVSSWKYGLAVILALIHDIAIPLGAFAVLGHFYGAELDTLFVVALLTTLALSISDTIVVFDRIREHISTEKNTNFPELVGHSLSETFVRSINTSLMVLVMVITLAVVGPASTKLFATVLAIGMFFGTYSSIFLASPLLVVFEQMQRTGKK